MQEKGRASSADEQFMQAGQEGFFLLVRFAVWCFLCFWCLVGLGLSVSNGF